MCKYIKESDEYEKISKLLSYIEIWFEDWNSEKNLYPFFPLGLRTRTL
jgi:hypothetical protein